MNPAIEVKDPATGEVLGQVPRQNEAEIKMAVNRARVAQKNWAETSFERRGQLLLQARQIILEHLDEIATLISRENGKPLIEAISHDIMPVMDLLTFFAKNTKKILKRESIKLGKWNVLGHRSHVEFHPLGVIGVISPWNFPFSIPLGGVAMALMAGNTVVLKPSEYTPLIGLKIGAILKQAGFPEDVCQVVTGDGMAGAALVRSGVDKITFTGSVATGKKIMAMAAETLTPVALELGGKDPLIVLPGADLDLASSAAVWGAFCNSGQVCASVERVYVPEALFSEFTEMVVKKTGKLRQGPGLSAEVEMGAMTAEMQVKKVEDQLADAQKKGAKILTGGGRHPELGGRYFQPTVISNVSDDYPIVRDETFGPVLPILPYKTVDEAVLRANDSPYALNAYVWAKDTQEGKKVASRLVAGTVNVNDSVFTHALAQTPWGGPKESGIGRTHGVEGILELVLAKHVHVSSLSSKRNNFWWFNYSAEKLSMMRALCWVLFGSGLARVKAAFKFLSLMFRVKTM